MFKERIIAYNPWDKLSDTEKFQIFTEVEKVLSKRKALWLRYSRGIDFETLSTQYVNNVSSDSVTIDTENGIQVNSSKHLSILLEKFIVDIASGYLSGQVEYDVNATDDIQAKVRKKVFGQDAITPEEALELKYIVDTITKNNMDQTELTTLFRDMLLYGSCYERVLDKDKEGYQYYFLDALNTVAVWTDDVKPKLMAVVQAFNKKVNKGQTTRFLYRVYLPKKIEVYSRESKMGEKDNEILKKEETRKYNEKFDQYADRLEKHIQGLKDVSDELGADIEKIEIKPMFNRILILPLAQNPFQRIKESKSGIIVDTGGFAPEFTNPDTGKVEEMEQMIITGVIQEVGPEVKYLIPGDVVMYRKETAMPVPFFKQGLICIAETQVVSVVNEGLEERFKNVRK